MPDLDAFVDHIDDDVLRLIFLTCHPALSPESRAALTLRLVGGLTVPEIARAFLTKDTTVGQRISRAKKTLAGESFELPVGSEREERLDDVMGVLYLIFNEGYTATSGDDWMRPDLCAEAIRLARMLAGLAPLEPDVHGLLALMELQASRLHARTDDEGRPVLLDDQDRATWDALLIRRGLASLDRAMAQSAASHRALRDPGSDRRLSRPRRQRRGDRLGRDRPVVRRAGPGRRQPGGRGQPGRGPRPRRQPGGRPGDPRRRRRTRGPGRLPPGAQRPRRPVGAHRTTRPRRRTRSPRQPRSPTTVASARSCSAAPSGLDQALDGSAASCPRSTKPVGATRGRSRRRISPACRRPEPSSGEGAVRFTVVAAHLLANAHVRGDAS